jgi:nucleoside-diphosphate-sugar epimerase
MRGVESLAVFGIGFTGRVLVDRAQRKGLMVHGYSANTVLDDGVRMDARDPAQVDVFGRLQPDGFYDCAVVTFPPDGVVDSFWPLLFRKARRVLLCGTTGIYARAGTGRATIDESSPLIEGHVRIPAEEVVQSHGGIVLRLAGIYGGFRNPAAWARGGRLNYEDRQVNLVHISDIVRAILSLAIHPGPRTVYNLADGQRHTARDIIDLLVDKDLLEHNRDAVPLTREDAFVSNQAFLDDVPGFRFLEFPKELLKMAAGKSRA